MDRFAELGYVQIKIYSDLPTTDIDDLRRVVMVVKDGRVYDPAAIYRHSGSSREKKENS